MIVAAMSSMNVSVNNVFDVIDDNDNVIIDENVFCLSADGRCCCSRSPGPGQVVNAHANSSLFGGSVVESSFAQTKGDARPRGIPVVRANSVNQEARWCAEILARRD